VSSWRFLQRARFVRRPLIRGPDDIRPTLLAASAAALATVGERLGPETGEPSHQALAILDELFDFLRSGLDQPQPARRS
jgi:hypothetical protein